MQGYIARRLIFLVLTLFVTSLLVFSLLHIMPGDPVEIAIGRLGYTAAERPQLAKQLGTDRSLPVQYLTWAGRLLRGSFGTSLQSRRPISVELRRRLPVSVELGLLSLMIAFALGVPLGVLSALKPGSAWDLVLRSASIIALSTPGFWLATLIIIWPSIWWRWSPATRYIPLTQSLPSNLLQFGLPGLLLAVNSMGATMRLVRSLVLEVKSSDYVRTARAKGLHEFSVLRRHVLRNSMIPVITFVGLQLPFLIGGTVIFENIFSLPGTGQFLLGAVNQRDYPVILALNMLFALVVICSNLVIDLAYVAIDPRIRLS